MSAKLSPGFPFLCLETTTASSQVTSTGWWQQRLIGFRFVTRHSKRPLCAEDFKKFHRHEAKMPEIHTKESRMSELSNGEIHSFSSMVSSLPWRVPGVA
jgi:hypothetical protein